MIRELDQLLTLEEACEHYEALPGPHTASRYLRRAERACARGHLSATRLKDLKARLERERPLWAQPASLYPASPELSSTVQETRTLKYRG